MGLFRRRLPTDLSWRTHGPYLLVMLLSVLAKWPTLNNTVLFIDEATYLNHAWRINSLDKFIYSAEHRISISLLGTLPQQIALMIDQDHAILIVRLIGLGCVIGSAWLMIAIAQRLSTSMLASIGAVIIWLMLLIYNIGTAAPLLEYLQTPLLLLSYHSLILALDDGQHARWRAIGAGAWLGLAVLVKPPAFLIAPFYGLALFLKLFHRAQPALRARFQAALAFALGMAIPIGLLIAPYLFRRAALDELIFNFGYLPRTYAIAYPSAPIAARTQKLLMTFGVFHLTVLGGTLLYAGARWLSLRRVLQQNDIYEAGLFATGLLVLAGFTAGQAKPHYLIPIYPFLTLFVASQLTHMLKHVRWRLARLAAVLALVAGLAWYGRLSFQFYQITWRDGDHLYANHMPNVDATALAAYIKAHSNEQDRIWVYYNAPEIYWMAGRQPASNEPTGSWLVDMHSQLWYDRTYAELERETPALIIGITQPHYPRPEAVPVNELPRIKDLIAQSYQCDGDSMPGITICQRR